MDPAESLNNKRAQLWALGHIGVSDFGVSYLASIPETIKTILDMTTSSEDLPLRGTCLKVANMFASSNMGKKILKEHGWTVSLLNDVGDDNS